MLDPFIVIGAGARPAGAEKLRLAAPDVDGDGQFILDGIFHQPTADLPGGVFVEGAELELLFFKKQLFQDFVYGFSFLVLMGDNIKASM